MVLSLSTILGSVKTSQLFALAVTTPDRSKHCVPVRFWQFSPIASCNGMSAAGQS